MTEQEFDRTQLSLRRVDPEEGTVDEGTRLSARHAEPVDDHTQMSAGRHCGDEARRTPPAQDCPPPAQPGRGPSGGTASSRLAPPPVLGGVRIGVQGAFGSGPSAYGARDPVMRAAAPSATLGDRRTGPGVEVVTPGERAARSAHAARRRTIVWISAALSVVAIAVLTMVVALR